MRFARLAVLPALLLAGPGCSDDVPPTPKGAFSVTFLNLDDMGSSQGCAVVTHNTVVGSVTETSKQTLLADGQDGAEISCKVTGKGPFNVTGSILQAGKFLDISIGALASGATKDAPIKGSVGYAGAEKTADTYGTKDVPCNFYFGSGNEGVAAGRAWASFECPKVQADQSICQLGSSYVIFENCDKGDTEE